MDEDTLYSVLVDLDIEPYSFEPDQYKDEKASEGGCGCISLGR